MKHIISKENRALLSELVRTDFKLRYQGSVLGYAWSLLRPLFMFLILYLVFAVIFKIGDEIPNFPIYLLLGIVLWNFFQEMTQQSLSSIVARGDLIRKIKIPRWLIIVSASLSASINLFLNLIIVFVFVFVNQMELSLTSPILLIYILFIYSFSLGCSLLLSALYVRFRDISYVWDVVLQAGFYATPILYPLSLITNETIQKLLFINPMAYAIQGGRKVFVTEETIAIQDVWGSYIYALIPLAIILITVFAGIAYFRKESKSFAENL